MTGVSVSGTTATFFLFPGGFFSVVSAGCGANSANGEADDTAYNHTQNKQHFDHLFPVSIVVMALLTEVLVRHPAQIWYIKIPILASAAHKF